MRFLLFLSALLAALTGSAATACAAAPQQVAGSCDAAQAAAPAHRPIVAGVSRPVSGRTATAVTAAVAPPARKVPLYQDRLRE